MFFLEQHIIMKRNSPVAISMPSMKSKKYVDVVVGDDDDAECTGV